MPIAEGITRALWPFPSRRRSFGARLGSSVGKRLLWLHGQGTGYFIPSDARTGRHALHQQQAREYFEKPALATLKPSIAKSISTGASMTDYRLLHRYVAVRRPRRVLELGSGVTSMIIAHALSMLPKDSPESRLTSIEHLPQFHENVKAITPPDLKHFVNFVLTPTVNDSWRGVPAISYESLPAGPYDLVFVDGPPNDGIINGDVFRLLENSRKPFDIIIDRRLQTCQALARFLPPGTVAFDQALDLGVARAVDNSMLRPAPSIPKPLPDVDAFEFLGLRNV